MRFKETGNRERPTMVLLHGGGLSSWSLEDVCRRLQGRYHFVTPIIDGHGEDGETPFVSIEDSAGKLLAYIDENCGGKVFALGGLSIGAQIVVEALSQRENLAQFAILESALVLPIRAVAACTVPAYKLFYGLIQKRWFSKMQAKTLFVPPALFELYYADSLKMTKQSLVNLTLSNGNYGLKPNGVLSKTKAKVLVIAGEKELGVMKKSARLLAETIPNSRLCILPGMGHGELSLTKPDEYVKLVEAFFEEQTE